jgi:rod shape-determining protein MreC
MAPPSPRRPGFSRRAQYRLFAGYVIAVAGALIGLLLVLTARFDPQGNAAIQNFFGDLFSPVSRAGRASVDVTKDGGSSVAAYFDAASKNKAMTAELKAAREKLIKGQVDALEVERLKKLVRLIETRPETIISARLVSSTGSSSRRYAILSAGTANGVLNGQQVIAPEGLVGRIVQTGRISSRVLLIVDTGNIVPVKRASDGVPALAIGLGDGRLELRPLAAGSNPFKPNDIFVTSGIGGLYRPGIPVAVGMKRGRETITGAPLASPARLDYAIVEQPFIQEPPPPPNELPRGEN